MVLAENVQQIPAGHVLVNDVGRALFVETEVVDLHYVGMAKTRGESGLSLEASSLLLAGEMGSQQFDRHRPIELGVPGQDHPAETTSFDYEPEPDDTPVERRTKARLRRMTEVFGRHLTSGGAYRVGEEWTTERSGGDILGGIRIYILGRDRYGNLVGYETFSAET